MAEGTCLPDGGSALLAVPKLALTANRSDRSDQAEVRNPMRRNADCSSSWQKCCEISEIPIVLLKIVHDGLRMRQAFPFERRGNQPHRPRLVRIKSIG